MKLQFGGAVITTRIIVLAGAGLAITGCATAPENGFQSQRGVFHSPYAEIEHANGPVGPECAEGIIRDDKCWIDGTAYPLNDRYYRDRNGNIVRLSRKERRLARERAESIQARIDTRESLENGTPLPPDSPVLRENQSRPAPLPKGD